ncbi:large exoprotein [Microbacterium sp. W1N]|uniref:large exoprotein n=1 Tax=Microbacterium festucae TaxID=2977531 RepID=UPI0021BEFB7C|nr:large exoprotein [Microbacterium festucae]MCT9821155.1 large exoprotein [Microbacterium festucae]
MGGQVFGGGVVVLVAVVLWLVYLLPSWHGRYRYNASERNAVRLSQALRVLAETSETPDEVRMELTARSALAQQKLARRMQADIERADRDHARAAQEAERAQALADAAVARQRALAERDRALAAAAAAHAAPAARLARARRRARLTTTVIALAALVLAGWGGWQLALGAAPTLLIAGALTVVGCLVVLQRMASVQRRAGVRVTAAPQARSLADLQDVQDVSLASDRVAWTPRELPRPLTASAGSRAAAVLDEAEARDALRRAALEEAMRERAAKSAPRAIDPARRERAAALAGPGDDTAIEAHVRDLLARRASGQ